MDSGEQGSKRRKGTERALYIWRRRNTNKGTEWRNSVHSVRSLGEIKKVVGPIPGGCVKDSNSRDKTPVVFGTIVLVTNNNFGVVDDRDVHPGYSIPWNTIRLACI